MPVKRRGNPKPRTGLLILDVPLHVVDMSRNGCLLESDRSVNPGTMGRLRINVGGRAYSGEIRIARCEAAPGVAGRYHLGAEFLSARRMPSDVLRSLKNAFLSVVSERPDTASSKEPRRSSKTLDFRLVGGQRA